MSINRFFFPFMAIFLIPGCYAATESLTISATIEAPTCDMSFNGGNSGSIELGNVDINDFKNEATPVSSGRSLSLHLSDCLIARWGNLSPAIKITGDRDNISGDGAYRTAGKSDSENIGVMLKYGSSDPLKAIAIPSPDTPFYWNINESHPEPVDQDLEFWVGMTRSGTPFSSIRAGSVGANIHFTFEWH